MLVAHLSFVNSLPTCQFQQNLILPENVDKDKIEAKVTNGVLDICIPKKTPDKVEPVEKQIEVL